MDRGVLVTVIWTIKPEAEERFLIKLRGDLESVVERPGFRTIRLHREAAATSNFILVEEWDSAKAFQDYMEYRNTKGDVADFFEWSSALPIVTIYDNTPLAANHHSR